MRCKHCGAPKSQLRKAGVAYNVSADKQKWKCRKCKHISIGGRIRR